MNMANGSDADKAEVQFTLPHWLEPVLVQVCIALVCAVFFVPIWLLLSAVTAAGLIFICVRFLDDNESLLSGVEFSRVKKSAYHGFGYFVPCLLILIPGFILAYSFDWVLDRGVAFLERMAAADQIVVDVPKTVEVVS